MDEFLYCYKPSEISQSLGFYHFSARGSNCRLVRSLPSSNRRWKTKFFFVSGFWAGNPNEVGKDPFPPYTSEMGHLHPEGNVIFHTLYYFFSLYLSNLISCFLFCSYETTFFVEVPSRLHLESSFFRRQDISLLGNASLSSQLGT